MDAQALCADRAEFRGVLRGLKSDVASAHPPGIGCPSTGVDPGVMGAFLATLPAYPSAVSGSWAGCPLVRRSGGLTLLERESSSAETDPDDIAVRAGSMQLPELGSIRRADSSK